ncbi:MAG: sigma-70 family RNA polymerase sigma factor [Clostridia bacterium]|nr:sigma-70 family RNA polymerase sigma factor [Clostridia bacterium]
MDDLELIFNKYYKYVKGYALSLCFDEALAEEITQEAFYKALKNVDKFKNQCRMETWLCTIARNEFVSLKRKRKTESIDDYSFLVSNESASQSVEDKEQVRQVLQSATQLPTPHKEVFYMKAMGELPFSVIAEVYGKTESWARVTYHRARQKIIERMKEYE